MFPMTAWTNNRAKTNIFFPRQPLKTKIPFSLSFWRWNCKKNRFSLFSSSIIPVDKASLAARFTECKDIVNVCYVFTYVPSDWVWLFSFPLFRFRSAVINIIFLFLCSFALDHRNVLISSLPCLVFSSKRCERLFGRFSVVVVVIRMFHFDMFSTVTASRQRDFAARTDTRHFVFAVIMALVG